MSTKEIDRLIILKKVLNKELTQIKAAIILNISTRQIRNLLKKLKNEGSKGIISKKRGLLSNRSFSKENKLFILTLIRDKYEDFGPTFASEKLKELDNIIISKETVRQWMIKGHIWILNRKKRREHLNRKRRDCFGELSQADGSIHLWFGEDNPKANATVIIDDATSILTNIHFSKSETLEAYYTALAGHLKKYGRPRALYTDRYAVFEANNKMGVTNMQKSLKALDITLILANSPQAKGRVERANRTLQDRLVKEFKLRGITTCEAANDYMPEFLAEFNKKFSKEPMSKIDAHRPLDGLDLDRLLCPTETRVILQGSVFQYKSKYYKIQVSHSVKQMKGRLIEIKVMKDGRLRAFLEGLEVKVTSLDEAPEVMTRKEVSVWKDKKVNPAQKRGWRNFKFGKKEGGHIAKI